MGVVPQHGRLKLNTRNYPLVIVSRQKGHSSSFSAGGDSIPKSDMNVGDRISFASFPSACIYK